MTAFVKRCGDSLGRLDAKLSISANTTQYTLGCSLERLMCIEGGQCDFITAIYQKMSDMTLEKS